MVINNTFVHIKSGNVTKISDKKNSLKTRNFDDQIRTI